MHKFVADMNAMGPHCFRPDNGGKFTSRSYVDCDSVGIRREYTAPGKPQQHAVVESAIWRSMKGDHAARREIRRLFPGVDFTGIPNIGANGNRLWLEAVLWAAYCFNRSATEANTGWRSPARGVLLATAGAAGSASFQPGMMRVVRGTKSDVQSVLCYYMNNGYDNPWVLRQSFQGFDEHCLLYQ